MTKEQQATRSTLDGSWITVGITPDGMLIVSSHNSVHFIDRVIYPDGRMSESYPTPSQQRTA